MTVSIAIADYGIGNLLSAQRAFAKVGADAKLVRDPDVLRKADRVVVPGVGAFADCVSALQASNLRDAVVEAVNTGKPVLGICVGMQMLFDASEEFGEHAGLGLIPGRVKKIPSIDGNGTSHKIPHIGWTPIAVPRETNTQDVWRNSILGDTEPLTGVYFVHSFTAWPENSAHRLADAEYGGQRIAAAVIRDNVSGTQFHPEKSGPDGLKIISRFVTSG